jgi:hypothetical protein
METLRRHVPNLRPLTFVPPDTEQIFGVSDEALTRARDGTTIAIDGRILDIRDVAPIRREKRRCEEPVIAPATEVELMLLEAPGAVVFAAPGALVSPDAGVVCDEDVGAVDVEAKIDVEGAVVVGPTDSDNPRTLIASALFEMAPSPRPS